MLAGSKAASFVARIWLESGPNGDPRWRGHVQHVQSGRGGFFDDLRGLRRFVEDICGMAGPLLRSDSERRRISASAPIKHKHVPSPPRRKKRSN